MNNDQSPAFWTIFLALAVISTALRTLIAMDKWNGLRFMFVKGTHGGDIFRAVLTFAFVIFGLIGLFSSLAR